MSDTLLSPDPVLQRILEVIVNPSERDLQKRVGPSDLADDCEVCLALKMLRQETAYRFGLKAWVGTAVHEKLERDEIATGCHDGTILTERKLVIGTVPGYGEIKGTTDRLDLIYSTVVDYKTSDLAKIKKYKKSYIVLPGGQVEFLDGQVSKYYGQGQLYGKGVEDAGHEVTEVALCFIPRDSNSVKDIYLMKFPYRRRVAEIYLQRAGAIYAHALEHGVEDLEPDPDCYNCKMRAYA